MRTAFVIVAALFAFGAVSAETIVVTVGGNTTTNASMVFVPQIIQAIVGDTVIFNFTQGNHTVTQSTFASPCVPAHDSNITINGFDSSFRDAGNGTAITILSVPILVQNADQPMWFFDYNTCGQGGVGVINNNESSAETLDGFERNAIRLNGTESSSSTSLSSQTATAGAPSSTGAKHSDAKRTMLAGASIWLSLAFLAISFTI